MVFFKRPSSSQFQNALKYKSVYFLINPKCSFSDFSMRLNKSHFIRDTGPFVLSNKLFDSHFVSECQKENGKVLGLTFLFPNFWCSHKKRWPLRSPSAWAQIDDRPSHPQETSQRRSLLSPEWHAKLHEKGSLASQPCVISESALASYSVSGFGILGTFPY